MHAPDPAFMHENLDDVRDFPLADDDVIIAGFPKSGTNWMQVMLANLWDDWTTLGNERRQVPHLAGKDKVGYAGYEACIAVGSPRLMKCHLPIDLMPTRWPEHGKVVHITRNPKDVCVSDIHEVKGLVMSSPGSVFAIPQDATMSDFVKMFAAGKVPYGPYPDNVIGWRKAEHPNLLKVTYEEARAGIRATLRRIVEFVGKPVTDERFADVISRTAFKAMKNSDLKLQINHPDLREKEQTHFMRKGIVGDWMNELSADDNALLDATVVAELERNGVFLTYQAQG